MSHFYEENPSLSSTLHPNIAVALLWQKELYDTNFVNFGSTYCDMNHRPSAMTCLGKEPRPSACLDIVPWPSAVPSKGASA